MGIHDGHRERMRESFRKDGLAGFSAIAALELLLGYAIPRRDTNPIAHALLDRFGSLQEVFDASEQELCEVEGIGPNTAVLIRLIPQIMRKSAVDRASEKRYLLSTQDVKDYLAPYCLYERDEVAFMLCLDTQRRVIKCLELSRGVVNNVNIDIRRVLELALKHKASAVILAHNHPDGPAKNSREDDMVTRQVYQSLKAVGIVLIDHLIVAPDACISYRDSGALKMLEYDYGVPYVN